MSISAYRIWSVSGRVIWRQNTIIPLRLPYRVREEKYKPNKDYLVYYPQVEGMSNQQEQQRVKTELKNCLLGYRRRTSLITRTAAISM